VVEVKQLCETATIILPLFIWPMSGCHMMAH